MSNSLAFLFCLLAPPVAVCAGGLIVRLWRPGPRMQAAVQHFTAGLVLGAVAIELAPEFVKSPHAVEVVIGFAIGAVMMLVVARLTHGAEDTPSGSSLSLFAAVAVDLFVDGLLVGTSFAVGAKQGVLVAIALAGCGFFLAITTATSFQSRGTSQAKTAIITVTLMLITIAGVYLAHLFSAELVGGLRSGTLAFATAALLYLVAEELMTEAHEAADDRPATPALFFTGFLLVYLLQRMLG
ncbi:MAG: hypothetical protein VX431_05645 [Planctomycetota bacterium]|nr:hypothetical protein [Planctomycetota bacterium]